MLFPADCGCGDLVLGLYSETARASTTSVSEFSKSAYKLLPQSYVYRKLVMFFVDRLCIVDLRISIQFVDILVGW
jgi:hypothetical protein